MPLSSMPPKGVVNSVRFFGTMLRGLCTAIRITQSVMEKKKLEEFCFIFSFSLFFKRPKTSGSYNILMTFLLSSSTHTPEENLLRYSGCTFISNISHLPKI